MKGNDMKLARLALMTAAAAMTAVALPPTANAGVPPGFQTPSGNILCSVVDGTATCRVIDHTYALPPRGDCAEPGWGNSVWLSQGKAPFLPCDTEQPGEYHGMPARMTLDYGQTQSAGTMSCDSEQSGVTCADSSTGHFFTVSRDTLRLG
jgi:hypothetical protein